MRTSLLIFLACVITLPGLQGTMNNAENEGRIDYIEIPTTDMAESKRFYGEILGWSFEDWGPDYASFNDGRLNGGLRAEQSVQRGGVLVIFYTTDLEAMKEKVSAAGGTIVVEHEFPGGRRFHFTDPSGNELAVWTDQ